MRRQWAIYGLVLLLPLAAAWAQEDEREGPADPFAGQGQQSTTSIRGTVAGEKDQPLIGARVTLSQGEGAKAVKRTAKTDKKGRWSIGRLSPGLFKIVIEADGYVNASGQVVVKPLDRSDLVEVEMRPLSEVAPKGYEGNPKSIVDWIEKGNSLLAQGHHGEARAEYEKAVPLLSGLEQAQVLRSMARTYYLEGKKDDCFRTLQLAMVAAPEDAEGRTLFAAVSESLGKADAAAAWLGRLEHEGAAALGAELAAALPEEAGEPGPALEVPPLLAPEADRRGFYRVAFSERSPLSPITAWAERFRVAMTDIEKVDPAGGRYELGKETYEVFVPEDFRRGEGWGVLVWVSPGPLGGVRRPELRAALASHKLIWIGANNAGNPRARWTRMGLALDAVHNLTQLYGLDPQRVYVGGYSGGGRVSSALAMVYPEVFRGAFCMMGVDYFRKLGVPDRPGTSWPEAYPAPTGSTLTELKNSHRWVLLTGELDFNRVQTKVTRRAFERDGFARVTYLEAPAVSHYSVVPAEYWERAFAGLDAAAPAAPR